MHMVIYVFVPQNKKRIGLEEGNTRICAHC